MVQCGTIYPCYVSMHFSMESYNMVVPLFLERCFDVSLDCSVNSTNQNICNGLAKGDSSNMCHEVIDIEHIVVNGP